HPDWFALEVVPTKDLRQAASVRTDDIEAVHRMLELIRYRVEREHDHRAVGRPSRRERLSALAVLEHLRQLRSVGRDRPDHAGGVGEDDLGAVRRELKPLEAFDLDASRRKAPEA